MGSFKFDDRGFKKAIDVLVKKADSVSGNYRLDEIFDSSFMRKHTNFSSIDQLLEACGIHNEAEFKAFPDAKLDKFIRENTKFRSWDEMKNAAGTSLVEKKLR